MKHLPSSSTIIILVELACTCSRGLSGGRISKGNSSDVSKAILSSVMLKLMQAEDTLEGKISIWSIVSACMSVCIDE